MSTIQIFAIISVVLLCVGFVISLLTDFESHLGFIIFICSLIGIAVTFSNMNSNDTETEVIVTESQENITEDFSITECSNDTTVTPSETDDSEEEEGSIILKVMACFLMAIIVLGPVILDIGSDFFDDVVYDIKESISASKEKKRLKKEAKAEQKEETSSDNSKEVFSDAERKTLKNLASSDSKVEYILWAVNYLDQNGREDNTRKLKNYYVPEILKAQEQFKKVKSYGIDEMTAEAKKHYKKIISLTYSVAKAEVKKAASEVLMDMDCNADVCEDIYKKDGYSSMREEIEKHNSGKKTSEKKKEKTLHARSVGKDTLIFWTEENSQ